MAKVFSVASWNVEHFRGDATRVKRVVKFLKDQNRMCSDSMKLKDHRFSIPLLFLHLASGTNPRGMGLRDEMLESAFKFRRKLDKAEGGTGKAPVTCSWETSIPWGSSTRSRRTLMPVRRFGNGTSMHSARKSKCDGWIKHILSVGLTAVTLASSQAAWTICTLRIT